MYIILAVSLLPTFRPPYFERFWDRIGIWMVRVIESLVGEEKRLICNPLVINRI